MGIAQPTTNHPALAVVSAKSPSATLGRVFSPSPSDSDPPKSPLKRGTLTQFSPLFKGGWGGSPGR